MGACLGKLSGSGGGGVDADALSLAGRPASSSNFGLEASSSGVVGGGGSSSSSSSSSSAAAAAASLTLSPPRPAPAPERLRASYYGLGPDGAVDDAGGTRRQRLRRGVVRFNGDARAGLAYLAKHGLLRLPLDPAQVAAFLHGELDGGANGGANGSAGAGVDGGLAGEALSRHRVGEVLGSLGRDEEARRFHAALLAAYCARFDFAGLALVPALRAFLGEFRLPGEAQVIDRLMSAFAAAYARDNNSSSGGGAGVGAGAAQPAAGAASASASASAPPPPLSADAAYVLSFAAVMLNTVRERGSERAEIGRAIYRACARARDLTAAATAAAARPNPPRSRPPHRTCTSARLKSR
jgi:hypothetical protein